MGRKEALVPGGVSPSAPHPEGSPAPRTAAESWGGRQPWGGHLGAGVVPGPERPPALGGRSGGGWSRARSGWPRACVRVSVCVRAAGPSVFVCVSLCLCPRPRRPPPPAAAARSRRRRPGPAAPRPSPGASSRRRDGGRRPGPGSPRALPARRRDGAVRGSRGPAAARRGRAPAAAGPGSAAPPAAGGGGGPAARLEPLSRTPSRTPGVPPRGGGAKSSPLLPLPV